MEQTSSCAHTTCRSATSLVGNTNADV
ncbi:ORFL203W [Human betaherpesvirus 5]|nr:ORFL203W [Human betaherpesvirus 5]QHX40556.1 ORFL203W [Human betaherpesvirus 5]